MSKRPTHDELIPQTGSGIAPEDTFRSAASGPFHTEAANQRTGETQFSEIVGRTTNEYVAPPSRLPMTMTQAESKKWNCDFQSQTPWDVEEGETGPMLAGTQMTTSATPVGRSTEDAFAALRKRGGGQ
jgi:hypothetical protein